MAEGRVRQKHKTIELAEELGSMYREYAHYTLLDRAIADVRDGFKSVHRRIVYAMGDMGLGPTSQHRKCARVGSVVHCFCTEERGSDPRKGGGKVAIPPAVTSESIAPSRPLLALPRSHCR